MAADSAELLQSFDLGPHRWPPDPAEGFAIVKFSAEYAVDEQKPNGKNDATIKNTGRKARKFSAELHWTRRIDDKARAYILQISPVGVNQGKAWEFVHLDAELYNIDNIEILTMGEIERTYGERTLTIGGISWVKKPPLKVGTGVASAKKPEEWVNARPADQSHVFFHTSDGNTIDMGPGPVTYTSTTTAEQNQKGFSGPAAPSAKVPL